MRFSFQRLIFPGITAAVLAMHLASPAAATAGDSRAGDFRSYRVIPLTMGSQQVEVAGVVLTVAQARRENYNAHGFSVYSFYTYDGTDRDRTLLAVPVLGTQGDPVSERESVTTNEGADCVLRDIRLLQANGDARLVIATRDFGKSYADPAPVHFDVYRFEHNTDGIPGFPPYDFRFEHRVEAKRLYCDVQEAFRIELGLGE